MMKQAIITTVISVLIASGCEASPVPSAESGPAYQPTDGRNLSPAMHDLSRGDPQWPNDVDRGGGSGSGGMR